jgi:alkanesulfonate monooxygenase
MPIRDTVHQLYHLHNEETLVKRHTFSEAVEVFATSPQSADSTTDKYLREVIEVAQWSEQQGCTGTLVYTDNRLADSWLVAQIILQNTDTLCPLVAVQPLYMHPYAVAKAVSSLAFLHGRRVYLNMVAGGFAYDLKALKDTTPHDKRYDRLQEYTYIIKALLTGETVTYQGEYYAVENLKLTPALPAHLLPGIFLSGSSEAGLNCCRALGATAIKYPKAPHEEMNALDGLEKAGIRIGIIARPEEDLAWCIAHERFPEDRKGQLAHQVAMKVSDSLWHKQLSDLAASTAVERNPYWLVPFQNHKTFCPYLVGSYDTVASEIARYIEAGYRSFILDIPPDKEELRHTGIAFEQAWAMAAKR